MKLSLTRVFKTFTVNTVFFLSVGWLHIMAISLNVSSLRTPYPYPLNTIISIITFAPVLYSVTFILQLGFAVWFTKKNCKNLIEVFFVFFIQFTAISILIVLSTYPGFIHYLTCREELKKEIAGHGYTSGDCMTFLENSRVMVLYIGFFVYLVIYTIITIVLSSLDFLKKRYKKLLYFIPYIYILCILGPLLLFIIPYLFFSKKPPVQILKIDSLKPNKIIDIQLKITPQVLKTPVPINIPTNM